MVLGRFMSDIPVRNPSTKRRKPARPTPKSKVAKPPKGGPRVDPEKVELLPKTGRKKKGDGPGGEYWEVVVDGKRAGEVFVNVINEPPVGVHASLQIFLNQTEQGKGIGRIAYRMAAEASQHDVIHLHMRKANIGSRIAAEAAGFVDASPSGFTQLILRRER